MGFVLLTNVARIFFGFVLKILAWFLYLIPSALRTIIDRVLGEILFFFKPRFSIVQQNLRLAYGDSTELQQVLAKNSYLHLAKVIGEIILLFGPVRKVAMKKGEIRGLHHWKAAKVSGRGVIFLASHVGNWELMAAIGALLGGVDIMLVTKRLKPMWLHLCVEAARLKCKVRATYEPKTLKDVLSHLRDNGTVGIVLDQYAGPPVGVRVPVFGIPVGTPSLVATLAKRTGACVLPVLNFRTPQGKYVVEMRPPLQWLKAKNQNTEVAQNTAYYSNILEKDIFTYPEQWLWTHHRFKGELGPLRPNEWSKSRVRK